METLLTIVGMIYGGTGIYLAGIASGFSHSSGMKIHPAMILGLLTLWPLVTIWMAWDTRKMKRAHTQPTPSPHARVVCGFCKEVADL